MKKRFILTLALLLFVCFTGCTQYHAPSGGGSTSRPSQNETESGTPYTVSFSYVFLDENKQVLPSLEGVYAQWTSLDGSAVYNAPFSDEGIAASYKPDGEYRVTLNKTPDGFTYDPNIYFATNTDTGKNVTITLYQLSNFTNGANGTSAEDCKILSRGGVYRMEFTKEHPAQYFLIQPQENGVFLIRSLLDVVANEAKLTLTKYANYQFMYPSVYPNTGTSGTYTKNFDVSLTIEKGQEYAFSVTVESVNPDAYPLYLDVMIGKTDDFDANYDDDPVEVPDFEDYQTPTGTYKHISHYLASLSESYPDNYLTENYEGTPVVIYNETDGYYHVGTKDGPLLVVTLTRDGEILTTESGQGFFDGKTLRQGNFNGKNYRDFLYALREKCQQGNYPVTKEIKQFLYDFNHSVWYFRDGEGTKEPTYQATESGVWMFACGYYE